MRKGRSVALRRLLYVAMLSLYAAAYVLPAAEADGGVLVESMPCDPSNADRQCGSNERCLQEQKGDRIESRCECLSGFKLSENDVCVKDASKTPVHVTTIKPNPSEESGGGSVAAGLLIPTFLIIIGVVLYYGARRYRWLQLFRQYQQNRYGNVLVTRDDDDDDDPPIA